MEILKVGNLVKSYGKGENKVNAVDNISFSVQKGEFVAIIGASWSGKSTLLHLIGGVDRPTSETVYIDGKDIYSLNDDNLAIFRRRQIGLIYQFYNLIPILNVKENITLPCDLDGQKPDEKRLEDLIKILKDVDNCNTNNMQILDKYGYSNTKTYIEKLNQSMKISIISDITIIAILGILTTIILLYLNKKQNDKIEEINNYLKELNNKNYELKIDENTEDELSRLRNELYKTTILLKESAENSENEKIELSNFLANISHQLKTPLTSIRILLDNIEENPDMDEMTRKKFIKEISNQIDWISSLVVSLLKLAKFDSGSIILTNKNVNLDELINKVIENLSIILDAKNVSENSIGIGLSLAKAIINKESGYIKVYSEIGHGTKFEIKYIK